jgi:hypothetical protein
MADILTLSRNSKMSEFITTYIDTSQFGSFKVTTNRTRKETPLIERPKMSTLAYRRDFFNKDIDEFRAKFGKEEGESRFFHDFKPDREVVRKDNLFMFNGSSALWQYALNQGTATANTSLPTPTLLTNANTYLYVGDCNYSSNALSGTASVTNGSGTVTFGTSQSGFTLGVSQIVFSIDSSGQVYTVTAGSGTSYTISPVFGGSTAGTLTVYTVLPASHTQTALAATTNIANQVSDSTYPSNPSSAQFNAVTNATNASPVVLTVSGADISANDIANVVEILGNTAANGTFVCNPASASSITLLGSSGSGSYTSNGYITKRNVLTSQSTFGSSSGIFTWYEWGLFNGNGSNKIMFNRRVVGLGSKAMGTSSALKIGISIS